MSQPLSSRDKYDISGLRGLLIASFNDEEFTIFCYDHFKKVHQDFTDGMTFGKKVQLLIEHCERNKLFGELLSLLQPDQPKDIGITELFANTAHVLAQDRRYGKAIERLEEGLTYVLSRALATERKFLAMNRAVDRRTFEVALRKWHALGTNDRDKIAEVRESLEAAIDRIHTDMSEFLVCDHLSFYDIIHAAADVPLVYLTTTQKGSLAFIILPDCTSLDNAQHHYLDDFIPVDPRPSSETRVQVGVGFLRLNDFTSDDLKDLLVEEDAARHITGGYLWAQSVGTATMKRVLDAALETLGKQLIEPLARCLREIGFKQVTLIPFGQLSVLPLHAAQYKGHAGPCYFLDEFEVTYAPGAWALTRVRPVQSQETKVKLISSGSGDKAFAQYEARAVADIADEAPFGPFQVIYEPNVTPQWLLDQASACQYLHLAHDVMADILHPLKSVVMIAEDVTLKLIDLLQASRLTETQLVTLSVVQPALPDFDQFPEVSESLPAILLEAGVASVVNNLWRINDLSTSLLMKQFYIYHFEDGLALVTALRKAQRWLREEVTAGQAAEVCRRRYEALYAQQAPALTQAFDDLVQYDGRPPDERPFAHPVYWAAFVISGA